VEINPYLALFSWYIVSTTLADTSFSRTQQIRIHSRRTAGYNPNLAALPYRSKAQSAPDSQPRNPKTMLPPPKRRQLSKGQPGPVEKKTREVERQEQSFTGGKPC
jgi:hypothetical protein